MSLFLNRIIYLQGIYHGMYVLQWGTFISCIPSALSNVLNLFRRKCFCGLFISSVYEYIIWIKIILIIFCLQFLLVIYIYIVLRIDCIKANREMGEFFIIWVIYSFWSLHHHNKICTHNILFIFFQLLTDILCFAYWFFKVIIFVVEKNEKSRKTER